MKHYELSLICIICIAFLHFKVIVRWTDVTDIQKKPGLLQETVKVSTR